MGRNLFVIVCLLPCVSRDQELTLFQVKLYDRLYSLLSLLRVREFRDTRPITVLSDVPRNACHTSPLAKCRFTRPWLYLNVNHHPWTWVNPPPSLSPTPLQYSIAHLPLIDVLPFPSMRHRILQSEAILDLDDLRRDVLELGLKCWGRNPWNERGWELPKEFVEKWWFLIDERIVETTNFWRVERGEEALVWKWLFWPVRVRDG